MKKLKNEAQLVKEAIRIGSIYVEKRGVCQFEPTDSSKKKSEYIYRLLVHDKQIQALPKEQENEPNIKHKLAIWLHKQLPEGHALLND
ncbi:DUF5062 family protein [Alkalimarinus coralli]|uniref:DUF5062 family protein n=1 Tax=Alkalimarinus coralli TaxID=2935863 RepID=UPI00202AF673|nr:DUF5062 family protein [Alkalimarinus coralli]